MKRPVQAGPWAVWLVVAQLLLCSVAVFILRRRAVIRPAAAGISLPYDLLENLEDAVEIDSPLPRLVRDALRVPELLLFGESVALEQGDVRAEVSARTGRIGAGSLRLSARTPVPGARVSVTVALAPGATYLCRGFVRLDLAGISPAVRKLARAVPEARISWAGVEQGEATRGPAWRLSVNRAEATSGASPSSQELLDLALRAQVSQQVGEWTSFEFQLRAPDGAEALEIRFDVLGLLGELVFSDVRLKALDFIGRFSREGTYRYLPTTEVTQPFKKMIRLGKQYRACLLAPAPSRFRFQLDLRSRPVLEFYTGLSGSFDPARVRAAEFIVRVRRPADSAFTVVHRSTRKLSQGGLAPWRPHELDLSAYAGQRVDLVLETRLPEQANRTAPGQLVPLWGSPVLRSRGRLEGRPNVLLLTIDCFREDRLGSHGYRRDCTPNLDRWAARGLDFQNAYSPSDHTYVTLPMIMIGRMLKYDWRGSYGVLDSNVLTLAERLKREGYQVGAFLADHYFNGFWKGFPFRDLVPGGTHPETDRSVLKTAESFLRERRERPTFGWIHLMGPHPPCLSSDRYLVEAGLGQAMRSLRRLSGSPEARSNWRVLEEVTRNPSNYSASDLAQAVELAEALYDGELWETDRRVGAFLARLEGQGLLEDTLLIVTSDHGIHMTPESLVERSPYESGLRVPLLLFGPGLVGAPARLQGRVSTIGIAATILDLLGMPAQADGLAPGLLLQAPERSEHSPEQSEHALELAYSLNSGPFIVWFDNYKYSISWKELDRQIEGGFDLRQPALKSEFLGWLSPPGDALENLASTQPEWLARGRRRAVTKWNSLSTATSEGLVNTMLVGFFRKAGYMR